MFHCNKKHVIIHFYDSMPQPELNMKHEKRGLPEGKLKLINSNHRSLQTNQILIAIINKLVNEL